MINAEQTRAILEQYKKHGWNLRRVLLCPQTKENLANALENLFGDAPIAASEIDAAWFSRKSAKEGEAWELRRLSQTPFALFEVFDTEDDEEVREEILFELEQQMIKSGRR